MIKEPPYENLEDIATLYRFPELDMYWVMINEKLKLWRFYAESPQQNKFSLDTLARFRPILLVHGYQSNHLSWNWMVDKLWKEGFRVIYAFEMDDYKKGFNHNMNQLAYVVRFILQQEPVFSSIDIIAHSMGGIISKHFVKLADGAAVVRLLVTLGSPFTGVFKFWSFLARLDYAEQSAFDFNDTRGILRDINETVDDNVLHKLTQVNVIGTMRRYLGTDGLFKNRPVSDMVNFYVGSSHFSLNKNPTIYDLILATLQDQYWFYKFRLLSVQINRQRQERENIKQLSLQFHFSVGGKKRENFPVEEELSVPLSEPFIPSDPIIMFANFVRSGTTEECAIDVSCGRKRTLRITLQLSIGEVGNEVENRTLSVTCKDVSVDVNIAVYKYYLSSPSSMWREGLLQ